MHIDITSGIFWRIMYEKSFINVTTWNLKFVWPLINCHKSSRCDFKVFFISGIPLFYRLYENVLCSYVT